MITEVYIAIIVILFLLVLYLLYREKLWQERRKKCMLELEKSEKNVQAKSDFLAKMSHDIRTPLNVIIGVLYFLEENAQNSQAVREYTAQIKESANYLSDILNDILDMSKIESGNLEIRKDPFYLKQIFIHVDHMIYLQAKQKQIEFIFDCPIEATVVCLGDSLRLRQIMMNLLSNALKFTPAGGTVELKVRLKKDETNNLKLFVEVRDTGKGMSEEFQNNLFSPFVQEDNSIAANYGGSGLGLFIVKNLVDLMQGKITVESQLNKGSCFKLEIPLSLSEAKTVEREEQAVSLEELKHLSGKKLLLVEDNELNVRIVEKILTERFHLVVDVAYDGEEAVNKFKASVLGEYQLILMDICMPVLNGMEATRQIRNLSRKDASVIPIICMSANAYDEDVRLALESGMNDHVAKPIELERLEHILIQYCLF